MLQGRNVISLNLGSILYVGQGEDVFGEVNYYYRFKLKLVILV
ncbi:MAG: hypothetical protein PUC74_04355 [Succinatimonas sp.]|nr:hypothetical protein [Succinatimonas sp.]